MQLCAQAICLEEMCGCEVPDGALFYGVTRRRLAVSFDAELRALTAHVAHAARANITALRTPPPVLTSACRRCSMADLCRPARLVKPPKIDRWLASQLAEQPADSGDV